MTRLLTVVAEAGRDVFPPLPLRRIKMFFGKREREVGRLDSAKGNLVSRNRFGTADQLPSLLPSVISGSLPLFYALPACFLLPRTPPPPFLPFNLQPGISGYINRERSRGLPLPSLQVM